MRFRRCCAGKVKTIATIHRFIDSLRHTCRPWLSSGGATLTTQKVLLRHADESTTSDVYGYPMKDDMRRANDQLVSQLLEL
jgi:integrase